MFDIPFAGYINFAACVKDQIGKGYSKETAQKICGLIEKRHKEKHGG